MVTNCLGANWPLQSRSVGQEHPTLLLSSHGLRNEILVVLLGNVTEQAVVREVLPVPLGLGFCFLPFFFSFPWPWPVLYLEAAKGRRNGVRGMCGSVEEGVLHTAAFCVAGTKWPRLSLKGKCADLSCFFQ